MDPIRQSTALDIQRNHRLQVRYESGRWRAYTEKGSIVTSSTYDDPVTALEAANIVINDANQSEQDRKIRKMFAALNSAKYMPWPRVKADSPTEWLILRVNDRAQIGPAKDGLFSALVEITKMVESGA